MAADTIGKVPYALFQVSCGDLVRVVFVAAVAGISLQAARMAGLTGAAAPFAMVQGEAVRLVELGRRPGLGGVAGGAIRGEQPGVEGRVAVAGDALLGCALEDVVHMTFSAFYISVRSGQLECSLGMVEAGFLPVIRCVAAAAICAELALVGIVFSMASRTILRRAFEDVIDMAFFASHICVCTGQLKICLGVIKSGFFPILRCMAAGAICAKFALVGVILGVAIGASRFGGLEICQCSYATVTAGTINVCMLPRQLERKLAVIEAVPKTVHTVVTSPAVCSISLSVRLHECRVDLGMATLAYHRIEACETGAVAVLTGEIRAVSHPLVGCQ